MHVSVFQSLEELRLVTAFAESMLVYPVVLGLHVIALSCSAGILALVDLRVAGLVLHSYPWPTLVAQLRPWFITSFVLVLATGVLLFLPMASHFVQSRVFGLKMALIAAAGVNALAFEYVSRRPERISALTRGRQSAPGHDESQVATRVGQVSPEPILRLSGITSLLLWVSVIALGRILAYI